MNFLHTFLKKGLNWMKVEARCHDCLYFLNPKTKNGIPRNLFSVPHSIIAWKNVDSQGRLSYIGEVAKQTSLNNSRNGSRQNRSLDLNKTGDMPEGCLVEMSHVVFLLVIWILRWCCLRPDEKLPVWQGKLKFLKPLFWDCIFLFGKVSPYQKKTHTKTRNRYYKNKKP